MSKICTECGCINENDNARFCNDCGAPFKNKLVEVTPEETGSFEKPGKLNLGVEQREEKKIDFPDRSNTVKESVTPPPKPVEPPVEPKPMNTQPTSVTIDVEENTEFYEEDEDDYSKTKEPDTFQTFEPEDEEIEPVKNQPITAVTKEADKVTNDPYYDDILPEINNEIKAIPKDMIYKGIGVVLILICVALFMLKTWG